MNRTLCTGLSVSMLVLNGAAHAQQQIEWKQTINVPKGKTFPANVKADILGIETGDSYAEAKAKLNALLAEVAPAPKPAAPQAAPKPAATEADMEAARMRIMQGLEQASADRMEGVSNNVPRVGEVRQQFAFQLPTGRIVGSYVGQLVLRRELGSGAGKMLDSITVYLSGPASGSQVMSVTRQVTYMGNDQPRIADVMQGLSAKFGALPQPLVPPITYRLQYVDGRLVPAKLTSACSAAFMAISQAGLADINRTGDCAGAMQVEFSTGLSPEHAKNITYIMGEPARAKANLTADFAYLQNYVKDLQSRTGAAPPKL